jgi:hypothetical protein
MINELYTAYKNLKKQNITFCSPHPDVKSPGKKAGFIVGIGEDKLPKNIEYRSKDQMHVLWTLRKGMHNSFPFIGIKEPLRKLKGDSPDSETRKELEKLKKGKEIDARISTLKKAIEQTQEISSLNFVPAEWTKAHFKKLPMEKRYEALNVLMNRLETEPDDKNAISQALCAALDREVISFGKEKLDVYEDLMIGHWDNDKKRYCTDTPIFLDLDDYVKYGCRIASREMGDFVSTNLPSNETVGTNFIRNCALTGKKVNIFSSPYPAPNLPVLGITYLFSMNKDIPCQTRYGKISVDSFPIDDNLPVVLQGTLLFLTKPERERKTWRRIPSYKKKDSDLLIVYLEDNPCSDAELGALLSDSIEIDKEVSNEARYEEKAASVIKAIEGTAGINDDSKIQILIMSRIDPGRKQVSYATFFTVKRVKDGFNEWMNGYKNTPSISLPFFREKGKCPEIDEPSCPSPSNVMKCLNTRWIREGSERVSIPTAKINEVYDLYVGPQDKIQGIASKMLSKIITNSLHLLIGIGGALRKNDFKDYGDDAKEQALLICSFLSILLYKLGHTKEDFMKDVPFNIGRLFALADSLHREYCVHVRKGQVPPQLIGNALMRTAMENPVQGLARLQERLIVYKAWADKAQGDGIGLTKWLLGEMGNVSNILAESEQGIPERSDDKQKAQILLGYLARSNSKE